MKNIANASRSRGFSLVELLVAVAIGLIVTIAVTSVVTVGETQRRSTNSLNEMGQSGSFAVYQLDRALRSAGSAFVQSANFGAFGCKLHVSDILPRTAAMPVPFKDNFLGGNPSDLRVAPVLIGKAMSDDDTSDVLVVMRGNGNGGGVPRRVTDPGSNSLLRLQNSLGFAAGDLLLVSREGESDCLLEQISAVDPVGSPGELTLGGTFHSKGDGLTKLEALAADTDTYVSPLGNTSNTSVQLSLFGIGANDTLFGYDLLRSVDDNAQALADGVLEMHALYGLDTNGDGRLDSWADPSGSGGGDTDFSIATVMTKPAKIRQIIAIRLALVLKSSTHERDEVTAKCDGKIDTVEAACAPYRYFTDLKDAANKSLQREVDTSNDDARHFRYRVIDTTIPLHNMQLLPAAL